jgi:hypothetical protein
MGKKAKVIDPLADVKKGPAKVKAVFLNPAASRHGKEHYDALPAFPTEIFACKNLEDLHIFRGIEDGRIPDEIGSLAKLKSLCLGGLDTMELPESIGKLVKLEKLDLAYQESLAELPAAIGKLAKLQELSAPYAGLRALPPMSGLRALRVLNLHNTNLVSVHPTLWDCRALEELHLPEGVEVLPAGIAKLSKLHTLTLPARAIAGIASELPKLKQLNYLSIAGDYESALLTELPDAIGDITSLEMLRANHVGLTSLPASIAKLTKLVELDVCGNKLSTLIDLVAQLPKLRTLDYSDNPVAISERRELDKLMKQPPSKRKKPAPPKPAKAAEPVKPAKAAKPAQAEKAEKPAKKDKAAKAPKLARVGRVASVNASLSLIIADRNVAKAWGGTGEGDDLDSSDWERARVALSKKDYAMLDIGSQSGVALSLGVGQGIADVFRIGERIVVVESIADNTEDELFLEFVASAPQKPKSVANLAVPSKKLVMVPTTDPGDGDESLSVDVPAKIAITIEAHTKSSWGEARRFFVTPVG